MINFNYMNKVFLNPYIVFLITVIFPFFLYGQILDPESRSIVIQNSSGPTTGLGIQGNELTSEQIQYKFADKRRIF